MPRSSLYLRIFFQLHLRVIVCHEAASTSAIRHASVDDVVSGRFICHALTSALG